MQSYQAAASAQQQQQPPKSTSHKPVAVSSQCLAIVLHKDVESIGGSLQTLNRSPSGSKIFASFVRVNSDTAWNSALAECVGGLQFVGYMRPGTLLVSASELHLECLRGAWARRLLKPPPGYVIASLGNIGGIEMQEVPQTQFIPLPEALSLVISGLNRTGRPATLHTIRAQLQRDYHGMAIPAHDVLYGTLQALASDGKLYCTGEHYFVAVPSMMLYQQQQQQQQQTCGLPQAWTDAAPYYMGVGPAKPPQSPVQCREMECQTGASIINGPTTTTTTSKGTDHLIMPPPAAPVTGGTQTQTTAALSKREKQGFFARLFHTKKSAKSTGQQQQRSGSTGVRKSQTMEPSSLPECCGHVATSANTQQPSTAFKVASSAEPLLPVAPAQPAAELGTFSAQFPPSEWLHDPRYLQQIMPGVEQDIYCKQRKKNNQKRKTESRRNTMAQQQQRFCMFPENLVGSPSNHGGSSGRRHRDQHKQAAHRFSKYLSSSSECLQYLGPVDPPSLLPGYAELEGIMFAEHKHNAGRQQQQRRRKHRHSKQHTKDSQLTPTQQQLRSRSQDSNDADRTPVVQRQPEHVHHHHNQQQLPGMQNMESSYLDSTLDAAGGGARTSTPTDGGQADIEDMLIVGQSTLHADDDGLMPQTPGKQQQQQTTLRPDSCGVDSALSTSPVVTEYSGEHPHHHQQHPTTSGSDKYSSWSGSETKHNTTAAAAAEHSHIYLNVVREKEQPGKKQPPAVPQRQRPAACERTYENLQQSFAGLSTTHFENITNLPSPDRSAATKRTIAVDDDDVDEGLDTSLGQLEAPAPHSHHRGSSTLKRLSPTYISAV